MISSFHVVLEPVLGKVANWQLPESNGLPSPEISTYLATDHV